LSEISQFAGNICDKLSTSGSIERTKIVGSLTGNARALVKLIGGSIGVDGSVTVDNMNYDGLPYEMLPEQMSDARACRKEVAYMLLEQKSAIENIKKSRNINAEYHLKKNGLDVFLMEKPNCSGQLNLVTS